MGRYQNAKKPLPARAEHDFYPTALDTIIDALHVAALGGFAPRNILEPTAGHGPFIHVARKRWPRARVVGVELQDFPKPPGCDEWIHGDFIAIAPTLTERFELVMGNPPFEDKVNKHDAEDFVRASLSLLAPGGRLVFLLNARFSHSQGRNFYLFRDHPPRCESPCGFRCSFSGDRGTADQEYTVFVWMQGYQGPTEVLRLREEEVAGKRRQIRERNKITGRVRIYPTNAEKQRQYRARQKAEQQARRIDAAA